MVLRTSIITLSIFALTSCGGSVQNAKQKDPNYLPNGQDLYTENCTSCHGLDGTLGKAGSKDLTKTVLDAQQLKQVVEFGTSNGMPRFKEILGGDAEVEAVVEYIMGFKRING